jgi:hypothetical protein
VCVLRLEDWSKGDVYGGSLRSFCKHCSHNYVRQDLFHNAYKSLPIKASTCKRTAKGLVGNIVREADIHELELASFLGEHRGVVNGMVQGTTGDVCIVTKCKAVHVRYYSAEADRCVAYELHMNLLYDLCPCNRVVGKTFFFFDVALLNSMDVYFPPNKRAPDAAAISIIVRRNVANARTMGALFFTGQLIEFLRDYWPEFPGEKIQCAIESADSQYIKCLCKRDGSTIHIARADIPLDISRNQLKFLIPHRPAEAEFIADDEQGSAQEIIDADTDDADMEQDPLIEVE